VCTSSCDDGAARIEELGERWCARYGKVEGEVFGGEDEAVEVGGGGADGGEVGYGASGFYQGDELDGSLGGGRGAGW